jgi:hypothetical protein
VRKLALFVAGVTAIVVLQLGVHASAAPPLPLHTIEGVGGALFTPMAYLVNPEPECACLKCPAFAMSYANLGDKNLDAFTVTRMVGDRIEFGYGANRLGLGTLPMAIRDATTIDIEHSDIWLHHFNVRTLLVKEGTCVAGCAMPAITAGVHFKYNASIRNINGRLGGLLSGIGLRRENGEDFTLTATRTIPPTILGRPVIVTGGLRATQGAQLGLLGFGRDYYVTFEGSVACLATDRLVLAYEFRQKPDPYARIATVIEEEDSWHGFDVAVILSDQATFAAGYGIFGKVVNTDVNSAWWLQLKYEF